MKLLTVILNNGEGIIVYGPMDALRQQRLKLYIRPGVVQMRDVKLFSVALSISCGVGVLMAVMLTGNKSTLPRTAVVVPTQNPIVTRNNSLTHMLKSMPMDRTAQKLPANVDPVITSSISKKPNKSSRIDINNNIAKNKDDQNPYPGDFTVTVKTGDTLFAISRRTGINVYKLASLNAIKTPYVIRPGQILVLGESE